MLADARQDLLDLRSSRAGRRRAPLALKLTLCCCFSCSCNN